MILWSDNVLEGKRILITGASSGIGRSCAILCSRLGANIIACGRDEERLASTISSLSGSGHIKMSFELNDESSIEKMLEPLRGTTPISGFIHSAGIERTSPLKTIYMDNYVEMFKTNVASAISIARLIMKPRVYDKNGLSIVLISSIRGIKGEKGNIEYSSTKSALYGLTKSMALELAAKNVRINSISPAFVNTEMFAQVLKDLPENTSRELVEKHLLGIPEPRDIANLASFLISDMAKFITGTNIIIDGGYSL